MKNLVLLALVATLVITGCTKDESNSPSYTGEVTINSTKTTFTDLTYYKTTSTTGYLYEVFNSTGENTINIYMADPAIGTLPFDDSNTIYFQINSDIFNSKNGAGSFTITQIDDATISATFTGTFIKNSEEIPVSGRFTGKLFTWEF